MVKYLKENKEFAIILLIAIVLRFIPAFSYQYSYDELCGLRNSIYTNWHDLINYGVKLDTHPILVQLIINATTQIFGYNEFWVKLPFSVFSIGAIIYAYIFSNKWFGKTPALITAAIFSFSYIFLFYAPLARMYAGGLFFCTAIVYYLFELSFSDTKNITQYFMFVLFILLAALNNHLSALFAFTAAFAGLFFQTKKQITFYLITCVMAVLLYLPHLSITLWQLSMGGIGHGQDGWLAPPDKWVLLSLIKTLLGTGNIWVAFVTLFLTSFFINKKTDTSKKRWLLLILFLINYSIIHLYSVIKAPIYQNSVMLFSAPCFVWFITSYFNYKNPVNSIVVFGVSCLLLFQSIYVKEFFENAVLNQNGYQSERYCEAESKYGKGNVEAYYLGSQRYFVIEHELKYNRKFNYFIGEDFISLGDFINQIKASKANYILLGEPESIELEVAKQYFPNLIESKQTLNVNYYLLSKIKTISGAVFENSITKYNINTPDIFEFGFSKEKMQQSKEGFVYKVDSLNEFCWSATAPLNKLNLREGNVVLAKIKYESDLPVTDLGLHLSINSDRDSSMYFGGTDIQWFYDSDSKSQIGYAQLFVGSELKNWLKNKSVINCFVWNRGKNTFRITGFDLETIDYWPKRWAWWD